MKSNFVILYHYFDLRNINEVGQCVFIGYLFLIVIVLVIRLRTRIVGLYINALTIQVFGI